MHTSPLVSVIIPTYNRFSKLSRAVQSVKEQTYKNIEIIVIDDASTDPEYRSLYEKMIHTQNYILIDGVFYFKMEENTQKTFGYPCAGYVRNVGAMYARGKYIAFLDDDDFWMPEKIETQIEEMKKQNCVFSCTEGRILFPSTGTAELDSAPLYNAQHYIRQISTIYETAGHPEMVNMVDGFLPVWTHEMIKIHNCIITSSVVVERELFEKVGGFSYLKNGEEDYELWLILLQHTNCIYINKPLLYYLYSVKTYS